MTGPEKTGLIYIKYTHPYYGIYLFFCVCYLNSVVLLKSLGFSAYMVRFVLELYVDKMSYCILKTKI